MHTKPTIPRPALVLGWLGVLPFATFSALAISGALLASETATNALILYGAIILSFMGGAQWGLAMSGSDDVATLGPRLAISVLPALAAFGLWFLGSSMALLGLSFTFLALLSYDISTTRAGKAPPWYAKLRIQLTSAVVVCLLLAVMLNPTATVSP